mmetsp:Transcript_5604/g.16350  ORF Transcript_5604/g.16350 Transcript_5604/m.16350 type:complete len:217 (-) Transcript_5604:704-1354(-)
MRPPPHGAHRHPRHLQVLMRRRPPSPPRTGQDEPRARLVGASTPPWRRPLKASAKRLRQTNWASKACSERTARAAWPARTGAHRHCPRWRCLVDAAAAGARATVRIGRRCLRPSLSAGSASRHRPAPSKWPARCFRPWILSPCARARCACCRPHRRWPLRGPPRMPSPPAPLRRPRPTPPARALMRQSSPTRPRRRPRAPRSSRAWRLRRPAPPRP